MLELPESLKGDHMRIRKIMMFILCILLLTAVYADNITETGVGKTEAEARQNATDKLASTIRMTASSRMSLRSVDDGSTSASQIMDLRRVETADISILGGDVSSSRNSDGSWSATITIPESRIDSYITAAENNASRIISLYNSSSATRTSSIESNDYHRLKPIVEEYETYRAVITMLDPEKGNSVTAIPTSSRDVEIMYENYLRSSRNADETRYAALALQLDSGDDTARAQIMADMAEIEKRMEENRRERSERDRQLKAEIDESNKRLSETTQKELQDIYSRLDSIIIENTDDIASSMVRNVESTKIAFIESKARLDAALEELDKDYEEKTMAIYEEELSRPYMSFELDENGKPQAIALKARNDNARSKVLEQKAAFSSDATRIYSTALKSFEALAEQGTDAIRAINQESFSIRTPNEAAATEITSFNLKTLEWTGEARLTIGENTVTLPFVIPFEAWTGIDTGENHNYIPYLDQIQELSDTFIANPDIYSLNIDFTIRAYSDAKTYLVEFSHYDLMRTSDMSVVHSADVDTTGYLTYDTEADFSDVIVVSELIDENSPDYPIEEIERIRVITNVFRENYDAEQAAVKAAREEKAKQDAAEKAEAELQASIEKAERKENRKAEASQFSLGSTGSLDLFGITGMKSFTDDTWFTAFMTKGVMAQDFLGFHLGLSFGFGFFVPDWDSALIGTMYIVKYIPLSDKSALEAAVHFGFCGSITEKAPIWTKLTAMVHAGYYHIFDSSLTLSIGINAAYMHGTFYGGAYAGIGVLM